MREKKQLKRRAEIEYKTPDITPNTPSNGGGGDSSWNESTDKPFYEEVTTSNVLEWDGDATGKETVDLNGDGSWVAVKVLDSCELVPSDLIGGSVTFLNEQTGDKISIEITGNGDVLPVPDNPDDGCMLISVLDGQLPFFGMITTKSGFASNGITVDKGIWLGITSINGQFTHVTSVTLPSDKFTITTIKPLDTKFLPKQLQIGENTVNILSVDGTFEPFTDGYGVTTYSYYHNKAVGLLDGETYTVVWDGEEYECVCRADSYFNPVLGNEFINDDADKDTGEPFRVYESVGGGSTSITTFDTNERHTVEIIYKSVAKLDMKYMPEYLGHIAERNITDLSWDGNIDTTEKCMLMGCWHYKISDVIFKDPMELVGASFETGHGYTYTIGAYDISVMGGIYSCFLNNIQWFTIITNRIEIDGEVFSPGFYVTDNDYLMVKLNGTFKTLEIVPIEEQHIPKVFLKKEELIDSLPEHLQFGDVVEDLVYTFDGNFEGKQKVKFSGNIYVKVSDEIPLNPKEPISVYCETTKGNENKNYYYDNYSDDNCSCDKAFILLTNQTINLVDCTPGVYFETNATRMDEEPTHWTTMFKAASHTMPFKHYVTHKMDEKYLPELTSFTMVSPSGKKFKVTIGDDGEFVKTEI